MTTKMNWHQSPSNLTKQLESVNAGNNPPAATKYLIGEKMSGESDENFEGVMKFFPDILSPNQNLNPIFYPRPNLYPKFYAPTKN